MWAAPTLKVANEELAAMNGFKADRLPQPAIAQQLAKAQELLERAGYR